MKKPNKTADVSRFRIVIRECRTCLGELHRLLVELLIVCSILGALAGLVAHEASRPGASAKGHLPTNDAPTATASSRGRGELLSQRLVDLPLPAKHRLVSSD